MSVSDLDQKAKAAVLLARGVTTDKVGEAIGVSGRTIRRWREEPTFEADVRTARATLLGEAVNALGAAARDAIACLHAALTDDSPNIRIRAASVLLSALPSISEHVELDERITALEAAVQDNNQSAA